MSNRIRTSQFVTCLYILLITGLLATSALPVQAQDQIAAKPQAIYLPLITAASLAGTEVTSDNPMAEQPVSHQSRPAAAHSTSAAGQANVTNASQPLEIGPGIYPLSGFDPNLPLDDLAPLDKIVGNADFVGLGEPVHTNGGSYQMKNRLFRYLVEQKGFRVLAFESPFVWVERLDQYLQSCQGSAADALRGNLFSIFNSTEVADLVQWMCSWNQTHPNDRLSVYGFDIQRMARENAEAVIAFLQQLGIGESDPRVIGIRACDGVVESFWPAQPIPQERYDQCQGALSEVAAYFNQNENAIRQQTSGEALGWARIHLRSEQAWQSQLYFFFTDFVSSYAAREAGMAELLPALHSLRFPHAKVAVWAHDGHVASNGINYLFDETLGGTTSLGDYLKQSLGHKYMTIGITAYNTAVNWPAVGLCGVYQFFGANPLEQLLHNMGPDYLLLDLTPRGNGHATLLDANTTYSIVDSRLVIPRDTYDALIYIEDSPAMHPLGFASCL